MLTITLLAPLWSPKYLQCLLGGGLCLVWRGAIDLRYYYFYCCIIPAHKGICQLAVTVVVAKLWSKSRLSRTSAKALKSSNIKAFYCTHVRQYVSYIANFSFVSLSHCQLLLACIEGKVKLTTAFWRVNFVSSSSEVK